MPGESGAEVDDIARPPYAGLLPMPSERLGGGINHHTAGPQVLQGGAI